ncbi:hypothetical protein PV04_03066 [Phialophora macrospora]|uniref:Origin recognition complex subunit 2 n=1 Tax=Phialophora macrospora TaxID=1851006 RepID=A0A0D2FR44_9EURO|nr:hypothetical protein PV04_03066 [Phialophora macrospora]
MAKRKQPETDRESDPEDSAAETPSKRRRRTADAEETLLNGHRHDANEGPVPKESPEKQDTPSRRIRKLTAKARALLNEDEQDEGSPTPKVNGRTLFATPRKSKANIAIVTPSRSVKAKADRSAKRKSARLIAEAQTLVDEDADEDGFQEQEARLAREILDNEEQTDEEHIEEADPDRNVEVSLSDTEATGTEATPTPRKRGRPRTGARTKTGGRPTKPARSPTPDGDIPPEERYFYQTRPGAPQVSGNRFNNVKLLSHEEYYEQISSWEDPHAPEKAFLSRLHARAFPQWTFELDEGDSLCLYGYGSKRSLVTQFAEWVYKKCHSDSASAPQIVILNGYVPKLNIRSILNTIASAATVGAEQEDQDEHDGPKLTGQPEEMLDSLLAHLTSNPPPQGRVYVMVNSIDGPSFRRSGMQSLLARLAAHPTVHFVCTADSTAFPAMWNSTHLEHFRFVYHDCTTFAPYEAETEIGGGGVVDQVHELLGRKRSRVGGKEGVGFVLKSLPENARNLYRLLLSEILTLMDDGPNNWEGNPDGDLDEDDDVEEQDEEGHGQDTESRPAGARTPTRKKRKKTTKVKGKVADSSTAEEVGVEYRALYRKASEEFICSSGMNFQFLLKEFLDHQMITSRRDSVSGAEMLGVPLGREEMEAVLEELV